MSNNKELFIPATRDIVVEKSIAEIVFEALKKHAEKYAQIDSETGEKETYASVLSKTIRLAQNLKLKGIKPEDILSLCCYNNMQYAVESFASFFIGAINASMDPTSPLPDLVHCLTITSPKMLFCDQELEEKMEQAVKETKLPIEIVVFGNTESNTPFDSYLIEQEPEESFEIHKVTDLFSTSCIHFSSGTTGYPKAVCVTHYSLSFLCELVCGEKPLPSICGMLTTSPFWISNMTSTLVDVIRGSTRIVYKQFDVKTFIKCISTYKVNVTNITPVMGAKILQHPEYYEGYDISSLRVIITGGSPTKPSQFLEYKKIFANTVFISAYGMTETGGLILNIIPKTLDELGSKDKTSIGLPLPGIRYKVVNPDTEELCGPNEEGELRVKIKTIMNAYYNNPQAYADAFDDDGFLKTGDIVYYDENLEIYYVTRIKDIFKYLGWHISPLVIETELLKHPNIKHAIVFGTPSEFDGDYATAAVIAKDTTKFNAEEIINFVKERLPDKYHLRGGVYLIESFPTTSTGKIQRRKLSEMILKMKNN